MGGKQLSFYAILLSSLALQSLATASLASSTSSYSITGTIYYSKSPLSGVRVELGQEVTGTSLQNTTTSNGSYRFSVAPGSYWVKAYGPTPEYVAGYSYPVEVTSGNVAKDIYLPKKINLRSPANNANVSSLHPILSWDANNEAYRYFIQINAVNGWQLIETAQVTSPTYTIQHELTPGVKYEWWIGANDASSHNVGSANFTYQFTSIRPDHELSVSTSTPSSVYSSRTTTVNATVNNLGLRDESNLVAQLFVNRSLADSKTISLLKNVSSTKLDFQWTAPSKTGRYNLSVYIAPVSGENYPADNRATNFVNVLALVSTTISCSILPTEVSKGDAVTISGSISPAVTSQPITLTYAGPNDLVFNRTLTSGHDGSYTDTYIPAVSGSWSIKASWPGDTAHYGATNYRTFTVIDPAEYISLLTTVLTIGVLALAGFAALIYVLTRQH